MISIEHLFISVAIILLMSVFASKASEKYGIPALLLFLLVGMLAGSEGPGGIYFDDPPVAQALGVTALAFILFAGGLETSWAEVRPVASRALVLSTLGVGITAAIVAIAVFFGKHTFRIDHIIDGCSGRLFCSAIAKHRFARAC
jgi:cell volume regulation protein A